MFSEDAHILRASSDTVCACISNRPAMDRIACGSVIKRVAIFFLLFVLSLKPLEIDVLLLWARWSYALHAPPSPRSDHHRLGHDDWLGAVARPSEGTRTLGAGAADHSWHTWRPHTARAGFLGGNGP